jgi:hypothetical protein
MPIVGIVVCAEHSPSDVKTSHRIRCCLDTLDYLVNHRFTHCGSDPLFSECECCGWGGAFGADVCQPCEDVVSAGVVITACGEQHSSEECPGDGAHGTGG